MCASKHFMWSIFSLGASVNTSRRVSTRSRRSTRRALGTQPQLRYISLCANCTKLVIGWGQRRGDQLRFSSKRRQRAISCRRLVKWGGKGIDWTVSVTQFERSNQKLLWRWDNWSSPLVFGLIIKMAFLFCGFRISSSPDTNLNDALHWIGVLSSEWFHEAAAANAPRDSTSRRHGLTTTERIFSFFYIPTLLYPLWQNFCMVVIGILEWLRP